ncbi:MAG: guanine deaminase [Bacteroidales bacterium]|nr:guanine deaminase [Bacteroidales bacterium]
MTNKNIAIRASIFHFLSTDKYEYFEDGILVVINGMVNEVGEAKTLLAKWEGIITIKDESGKLLMPGFIDGHTHAVQSGVMASYGEDLLNWLEDYTFPYEKNFKEKMFCEQDTNFFFQELLKNGTTTAAIYSSVHQESIKAILEKGAALNMRIIAGKTNMDRNAPVELLEDGDTTIGVATQLINKYHKYKRLSYALTPRFAITSTPQQLEALKRLKQSHPQMHVQTHISENRAEIENVKQLFSDRKDYLDVYEHYGLVGKNTLLGHGLHFSDSEWLRIQKSKASLIHCPTSNLFLGSGLFNLKKCQQMSIPIALGSDIGAGTSFSMLKTAAAAYQVAALKGDKPTALNLFYILTLGGATALGLDEKIGNLKIGKEADFILLDMENEEIMAKKNKVSKNIEERLFSLMMLGDDRNISDVYLMGEQVKR